MGLESTTYIDGLTATWPEPGDPRKQGDDHLRLIKTVLKNTFPNADKPFRFPSALAKTGAYSVVSTNNNGDIFCDTTSGDFTLTLPVLGASDGGWEVRVTKTSTDANGVKVVAASGNVLGKVGSVASVRVGVLAEAATFRWTGTAWICSKPGPMIGTTEEFNGASLPPGYLWEDGATFVAADFAELYSVLGGNTKPDKRGRVSAGQDDMGGTSANRLTGLSGGVNGDTLGATGGEEAHVLIEAELAAHDHPTTEANHTHGVTGGTLGANATGTLNSASPASGLQNAGTITISGAKTNLTVDAAGGDAAHNNVQPTIIVNKILRAC